MVTWEAPRWVKGAIVQQKATAGSTYFCYEASFKCISFKRVEELCVKSKKSVLNTSNAHMLRIYF